MASIPVKKTVGEGIAHPLVKQLHHWERSFSNNALKNRNWKQRIDNDFHA